MTMPRRWGLLLLCAWATSHANTLVEQARNAGVLDDETALEYQVYAVQAPDQVPAEYRQIPEMPVCGTPAVASAQHAWSDLSPATRQRLAKVLTRPFLTRSLLTSGGHFRVHYDLTGRDGVDATDAGGNGVPDYVDTVAEVADRVWDLEVDELGYKPPPSDQVLGGGPEYDLYIVELGNGGVYGYTYPEQEGYTSHSYIEIDNNYTDFLYSETRGLEALKVSLAHEFFHAIHFGYYEAPDVSWWREASATWMEEVAYPEADDYLQYLDSFLMYPDRSLNSGGGYTTDYHVYGASLFVHFLDQRLERRAVRLIWEELGRRLDGSLENYDRVLRRDLNTDLDQVMGEFSVWNYFTGSRYRPGFYAEGEKYPEVRSRDLQFAVEQAAQDSGEVDHLGSAYIRLQPELQPGGVQLQTALSYGRWSQQLALIGRDSLRVQSLEGSREQVPGWDQYDEVVLVLASTEQTGMGYGFKVSAEYDPDLTSEPAPVAFRLGPAYPNPFVPERHRAVVLPFELEESSHSTRMSIFASDGRLVRRYELGGQPARSLHQDWDGRDQDRAIVGSGIYYYVLETDRHKAARPLGLVRE